MIQPVTQCTYFCIECKVEQQRYRIKQYSRDKGKSLAAIDIYFNFYNTFVYKEKISRLIVATINYNNILKV